MIINAENLAALMRTYSTAFQQGISIAPPADLSFLSRDFPSSGAENFYAWIEQIAAFREWLGDRVFNNVKAGNFSVKNRDWEDSVSVPKTAIDDDTYGVYSPMVQMMSEAWTIKKQDWILEVLTSNPVCFTGKAFFATDHAYGANIIANLSTDALSKTSFEAAYTAAAAWKFSNGMLVKPRWTHLLHGPKLQSTAFGIVDAQQISDGSGNLVSNPNYKRCARVEVPDLAGDYDDYWFLVDGSKPVKAVARQIRKEAQVIADLRIEQLERTGQIDIMSSGRGAAGPTFPHLIYGGIL